MIGNTKKMPKTLEQHLGWSQGCQAMLTKCSEMWRIINININIFDNDDGTLGKHWSTLNNTSETLRDIEKTPKNIKHSWENSEECQLAPKTSERHQANSNRWRGHQCGNRVEIPVKNVSTGADAGEFFYKKHYLQKLVTGSIP
jgi:hypothetical protein